MIRGFNKKTKLKVTLFQGALLFGLCLPFLFLNACSELEPPETETFYADSDPPRRQEFRWSNGTTPKSFDPARAAAPPETDIVRAIYDGLTETDSNSLEAVPAIAAAWESSADKKIWTFELRKDARWSNGDRLTAEDFVRSWKRLAEMGDAVSHHEILKNIVGMQKPKTEKSAESASGESQTEIFGELPDKKLELNSINSNSNVNSKSADIPPPPPLPVPDAKTKNKDKFGVEAVGENTLKITLIKPDKEFPKLAAHPVLRPVYEHGREFEDKTLNPSIVTSGAFRITSVSERGITLKKSETYYNKAKIKLERVRFVPAKDADSALQAYRRGEVDAVTNAEFEPLALKLLLPYFDFQRTVHSALNFYEFNRKNQPFNDRRVRQALAIAIERERLTEDETQGATKPALTFLPFDEGKRKSKFALDVQKSKELLKKAGFPNGENFPKIRLVINRNDMQQRIARSVARMWKENLNIETEIIVRESAEIEELRKTDEFDVIRRGVVLPTANETANMLAIFAPKESAKIEKIVKRKESKETAAAPPANNGESPPKAVQTPQAPAAGGTVAAGAAAAAPKASENSTSTDEIIRVEASENFEELLIDIGEDLILTEEEAIIEVPAIPLYFPMSYSLVKPYVKGFELNNLDAPLLKEVEIDNSWQPKASTGKS